MIDILTIGDCDIDLYMKVGGENVTEEEGFDQPKICFVHGSKIPVDHFESSIAGNSLNVAIAAKNLGLNPAIYTELGDDENGQRVINELNSLGITSKYCLKNSGKPTNVHAVIVFGGDRTIFSYHDKREYKILDWEKPKWIYYSSMGYDYEKFQPKLIEYLQNNPDVGLAFNPGSTQMKRGVDSFRNVLSKTDILFVNKEEAQKIVGQTDFTNLEDLHKKVLLTGPKLSVITDGTNGASYYDGKNFKQKGIYTDSREVLDRTGAGDAFSSGFMSAIIYGKNLEEALNWGLIESGICIKTIGATKGLPSKEEIEKISKEFK